MVIPAIRRQEAEWFCVQVARLVSDGALPLGIVLPFRQPVPWSLLVAPWGRTMWRFCRAWCVATLSGGLPLALWGKDEVLLSLAACPLCGAPSADLVHILERCAETACYWKGGGQFVASRSASWALQGASDAEQVRPRVRILGLSVGAVAFCLPVHLG